MTLKRNPRFFWLYPLLALSLSILACNFPTTVMSTDTPAPALTFAPLPTDTPAPPTPVPTQPYQSVFNPAPCAFPVPSGYRVYCGYMVVPENRAKPDSALIQLHVAVFQSFAEGQSRIQ